MTECPRCLFTSDFAKIGFYQCNYCDLHDELESKSVPSDLMRQIEKVVKAGKGKKYDCIMGISGGLDSSTLLYAAVRSWKLRPLVIHFDNNWNAPEATHNMDQLVQKLNVDCIVYKVNKKEYDNLNDAFLAAGLPDADIPNDIAMTKLMYQTADQYGIRYILNGHDFRTEGSTPASWTYMDARYIQSVYYKYTGNQLQNYPLFTFTDQIKYGLKGIKNIRPFHYIKDRVRMEADMKELIGWQDYGGKHCENVYTEFVGSYLLPKKFKIDKRIVYLSAQVRSGSLNKDQAKQIFAKKPKFDLSKLGNYENKIERLIRYPYMERSDFDRYDFKKYKTIIWLLAKFNVVPYTFYKKYCS
jgi:3'-phosphoadenosine 5'-phosphosulfate sulfotransferase (PAPS reductase)/FAD synthetase